ncbi:early nodulin-75-like, partial [Melanaphis sacchari]|uniref:early nodulin-75-like n=1 Tax=Melanaphis sacchari TaxID=742174 RepID=UPI000DC14CCE
MAMEVKIKIAKSDQIGKGPDDCKTKKKNDNNVVDVLDMAVPQSKVRPIDRLLDRYDWSSASMTPLLRDAADLPLPRSQYGQTRSGPAGRPVRSRPPQPPPPPHQPPPSYQPPSPPPYQSP